MSTPLSPTTNSSFIGEIGHFLMRSISSKTLSDRIASSPSSVTKSNSSSSLDIKANPSIALACKLNNLEPVFTEAEYVHDGAELSNLSVAGFNVETELGGNCPDQSAQEYMKELKSGAFEFDPTHFYAFGSLEPVGVIIVSIDKEKRNGCVRSKLGVFRYPLDPALSESHDFYKCAAFVLAKFMSRYGYLWTSQSRSSTTTLSETAHDSDHTRYHSVHSMSHKGASESDQKELQAASDAFFASARYSDELTADQLVPLLKSFGNCFKYHPVQHVVVDVYDLTEGVPCFYDVEAVFGVPTVSVFAFDRKGPALIDLFGKDQDLKRPGVDEFKDPGRSPIDEPEKRNGLFMEIYDIEVKYQKNLEMMMDMYACFETRIKEDKAFSMDKYHLINCFPDVSEFKKISAAFSSVLKSKYFDQPKPNMQVYIRLLLEYVDQFEPLILKAVKDVTPFQEMLDKFKDKDDVKMQFEIAYELIQKKNNGTYHDINTLVALPFSRLHYLRSGVTSILQCTPTTHPLSPLFLTTATRIHILSRRIECTMEELEAKTFMIKLGKALDNSEIVSAHRSYLSDYVVEASPLNWEVVSGGVGCGIMLLSDMVLFLGKWQERSGGKVAYRVQRYVVMDDLVAVERDGREIIFVIKYTLNPNAEKNETILRFICESEVYCDNMFREIRHVWISHTWGHCYIGASHKRIPIYVMKRDEISVYYRMLKSVDSLEKAGFKNTVYADVGFVFGIDSSIMENIASQVIKKYTYFGAFSSPKIQTDFLFRTTQSHSIKPHQLHSLHGQETLSSTLFHTSTTPLHFTSPQSPLHTHLRKLHLTTTLHTFPRVSLLRKASFACKQILKTRSRRQSTASLFSNTDTDRASITDSDAGSFYASERGDSSPEKKIGFGFGRVRTMSNVSVDSKGIRAVGTQGRRPTWFRKTVGGTSPVKKRCWDRLSDLEVLRGLCEEIEGREEKMAYNNAAVAAATLPESIVYSRAECIATATRSKLASGFILALRHLLNSAIGPFTFCETFILTRPIQQLLLSKLISVHSTLNNIPNPLHIRLPRRLPLPTRRRETQSLRDAVPLPKRDHAAD
ncbi:hypothetical protein BCR33DRAFT_717268 [Rhizoclosmatium globosum]|uniref:DH domain-containing protein n=1 Tax=Rhizoclosmatium globosum TaxID=329046 RepID=A0A1Y2CAY5_9FUNG|nr:hypothetical protein BCR33DRAFT_717268 [Rhizoclosmatium globosum]|eukprot:ORY44200.1 hypothetical protein BCR33DRAFT_717268 [Rhizoclosmatium globosum]